MTVNVLVTGAGGLMAHFILKALRASPLKPRVIGCDHSADAAGLLRTDCGYVVPSARDDAYIPRVIELCKTENVRLVIAHGNVERHVLAQNRQTILRESGAVVATPSSEVLQRLEDKWGLVRYLEARGLDFPRSVLPQDSLELGRFVDEVEFPYIVKDRFGWGSRGVGVARNRRDLEYLIETIPNPVVQEYLGSDDEEFTVGVFVDAEKRAAASIVMKRELGYGMTMKAVVLPDSMIGDYCKNVVQGSGCFGPTNVQLRMSERGPVVFEINARFSTTASARCEYGYNEADMCIRSFVLGETIVQPVIRGGRFVRVIEDVVVDESALAVLARDGRIERVGQD